MFNADDEVPHHNQRVTTTRASAQPPQTRPVTIFDRPTSDRSVTASADDYDLYDASQSAPRQAVYSSTAPGQAAGRSSALPLETGVYDEQVPAYSEANDAPFGHRGRNDGASAVKLDRDLYVTNGPTVRD